MQSRLPIRNRKDSEDGFMLLAAIFMIFLLVLSLSIAIPQITKQIQRDREVETMHRGLQYRRAIQLYYRKFGAYPPSIDALVKTNNIRFLRKKYLDPMTGKDDWKTIGVGQNKAPLAMGFFGQPLAGAGGGATPIAGTGPSGGNSTNGLMGSGFGGTSGFGGSNTGSSGTLGSIFGSTNTGSTFGTNTNTNSGGGISTGSMDNSGNTSGTANGTAGSTANGVTGTGTGTSSTFGPSSGQTFGGGVVGVEPPLAKQSILLYKKKNHYNEWEFTYSPLSELKSIMGGSGASGLTGSGTNQNGTGFGGTTGGFGGSTGGFGGTTGGFGGSTGGFGGSSGFGGSGGGFGGSNTGSGTNPSPAPQQNQ